jgi:L-threonylcarbamoyladenylate synthase
VTEASTRLTTDVAEAVAVLRAGGLVGLPTETVYGLAADASRPRGAIVRVYEAKGRPTDHPLIVHVAGAGDLDQWARDVPCGRPAARRAVVARTAHRPGVAFRGTCSTR